MTSTMRSSARVLKAAAALGLVAALTAGCQFGLDDGGADADPTAEQEQGAEEGGDPDEADGPSDGGGEAAGEPGESGESGDPVVDEDAQAAGVDLTDVGEPIASAEVPAAVEGDPEATMTVSLHGLTRQDETLVAVYSFRVEASEAASTDPRWIYHYAADQGWNPYAVDTTNLNRHGVLSDSTGTIRSQTEYQGPKFRPGQTLYAYAMFAAPPEDVTTMDVLLIDGAPLATEVEIR